MKLLGNYKNWIKQEWIDYCLAHTGQRMPKDYYDSGELEYATHDVGERLEWFHDWGIDPNTTFLERFDSRDIPFNLDFSWLPEKNVRWGILKYKPGGYMPLHSDDVRFKNERRLWMPMQDYVEGHMVLHDGEYFKNWKSGDLFHFENSDAKHGFANISGVTRLVFTIVVFPEDEQ
jgi:hypothetical protein